MIYITPTPIGNLDDITVRAIKVLSKAKVILCEDGKITSKLLGLLKIENKPKYINLVRNNKFNESGIKLALSEVYGIELLQVKDSYVEKVQVGNSPREGWQLRTDGVLKSNKAEASKLPLDEELARSNWGLNSDKLQTKTPITIQNSTELDLDQNVIAIVTDAGTPGISDPAFEIIQLLQQLNLDYTVLPGATACIPAIVASNLVSKEFTFLGFLPLKKGRQTIWREITMSKYPVVIYESCHRIAKLIDELQANLKPEAKVSISQELSKKYENTWIGCVGKLKEYEVKERGEFVVVVDN
jgi:16S rRNA (cytidine1402-2'-O)-methyltransferase